MTHTTKKLLAVIGIAGLALVGCGSTEASDEPQSAEEAQQDYKDKLESGEYQSGPPAMPAGQYEAYAAAGGHILMEIPANKDDEVIAEIESYRETTGADPVTYLTADVDNRQSTDSIGMRKVKVFDQDGTEYEFTAATDLIEQWGPSYTSDYENVMPDGTVLTIEENKAIQQAERELLDKLTGSVSPAGRDTIILIHESDNLPDEYTRVAVQPGPFGEEVEAYPTN